MILTNFGKYWNIIKSTMGLSISDLGLSLPTLTKLISFNAKHWVKKGTVWSKNKVPSTPTRCNVPIHAKNFTKTKEKFIKNNYLHTIANPPGVVVTVSHAVGSRFDPSREWRVKTKPS